MVKKKHYYYMTSEKKVETGITRQTDMFLLT